ncbi:MAG: hypothetical protein ACFFD4_29635 [Candidatus Odinarchaeota archaeon]
MAVQQTKGFLRERQELASLLADKRQIMDREVIKIIETFIELLSRFQRAVKEFDLEKMYEYLADKAENFYQKFKVDSTESENKVRIEKDEVYIFSYASVSLFLGTNILLYPFMLVAAANYRNFIPLLCRRLRRSDQDKITTKIFFEVFYELYSKGKPKLLKYDIDFLKKIIQNDFKSSNEYFSIAKRYKKKKRYRRLMFLRVLHVYAEINFPSLGLIPYINVAPQSNHIPEDLQPFIEIKNQSQVKYRNFPVFRLFLLPLGYETEWSRRLAEIGLTEKMEEWYNRYNWDMLRQTSKGTWKWELDLSDLDPATTAEFNRFDLVFHVNKAEILSPRFISFIETVHRLQTMDSEDLSAKTGIALRTINRYIKNGLEEKIILPIWNISRIGLDGYYQIIFENKCVNESLIEFLEAFPRVKVMKSKKYSRYLIFLPQADVNRFDVLLKNSEKQGEFELLSRGEITLGTNSIERGVNLNKL